ncbi:MAG: hypothetical protein QOD92_1937 [Acidimicrobiaceae bacterium]|jgi:hypothetical protein
MVEHVAYDIWMLHETSQLLGLAQTLRLGRPWQSALLESFLIHARNLVYFLYPPKDGDLRDGDVLARDYPSTAGLPLRPHVQIVGVSTSDLSNNISRRIAHIHTMRTDEGLQWAYGAVANVLLARTLRHVATIETPYDELFRSEFSKLGWELDEIVAALPLNEEALPEDLLAMQRNKQRDSE